MFKSLDSGKCVGVIFLDLKKAFDTVCHHILLSKLEQYGISDVSLSWFRSYLSGRTQCTQVNGVSSDFKDITCGVPQGSILGPLLFIIYINDLSKYVNKCEVTMYADDTALMYSSNDPEDMSQVLNNDLNTLGMWFQRNQLTLNVKKTNFMIVGTNQRLKKFADIQIGINGDGILRTQTFKYLGIILDETLSFNDHVQYVSGKIRQKLGVLSRCRKFITRDTALTLYKAMVLPHFDYCDNVWDTCNQALKDHLQVLQNRALRVILRALPRSNVRDLHNQCKVTTLQERRDFHLANTMYKALHGLLPVYLANLFSTARHSHRTRAASAMSLSLPKVRLETGKKPLHTEVRSCITTYLLTYAKRPVW